MYDISKFVRENKQEAFNLLKENGGRIDFIENPESDELDSEDVLSNCPAWVALPCGDGIMDYGVLAVESNEGTGCIDLLLYNTDTCENDGWYSDAECLYNSENCVYETIYEHFNK